MDPTARILRLLSLLQTHRYWPGGELADRLEVSPRTLRRDVDRLRELGYPVDASRGVAGGYQLQAGAAVPPLLLDDDEAVAIAVGLRTAAGASVTGIEETAIRALVKLEQVLPSHLRRRVSALQSATETLPAGGPSVDPQALTVIAAACRDTERIRFAYRDREGTASRREVEPHSLVNLGRRWYLVAWDRNREDWRTFRMDRLDKPAPAGGRFEQRKLPAESAAVYVQRNLSARPWRYEARVTLHAPAEEVRRHVPSGWGTIDPVDEHTCEYRTGDDHLGWLALRVSMFDVDFDVEEPQELREHLRLLSRRLATAASEPPARGGPSTPASRPPSRS